MTTSVAWEGWSLLSVTAGTSVGTCGHWGVCPSAHQHCGCPLARSCHGQFHPQSITHAWQDPRVARLGHKRTQRAQLSPPDERLTTSYLWPWL